LLVSIKDIGLGNLSVAILYQYFLDSVLDFLDMRRVIFRKGLLEILNDPIGQPLGALAVAPTNGYGCAVYGIRDALLPERDN
jgi:hypothetical protein